MTEEQLLYAAYLEKKSTSNKILDFPFQEAFVNDPSKFIAAQCTRRAGKTNGLALRFYRTMMEYPGSLNRYIALTRDSAKDIMWPVLEEMNEIHNWQASFTESPLCMTIPNGSKLRLIGADMKNFIPRLRGAKCASNAVDESQSFGPHLASLIDDVLTPTMVGYSNHWLALTGTPGPVPRGTFFDVTHGNIGGYSVHKWSIYDNPHLPGARKFVEDLKTRNKWPDDHPTYLREWCNQWVIDLEALLIKYNESLNHYETLPTYKFNYILGIDIGVRDSDALAVLAWSESSPHIYLVEEIITEGQDITGLTEQIQILQKRYELSKIVIDTGGLGLKIAEEIRRRKSIPVIAADKKRKFENVAFLNDYLRLGKFKAKKNSRFAQDSYMVQIDWEKTTPDRLVVKDSFHSDIIDSVLYAFKESPAWAFKTADSPAPKWGTKEWAEKESDQMERDAEEYFLKQEELNKDEWTF